jgi:hypothetical protein
MNNSMELSNGSKYKNLRLTTIFVNLFIEQNKAEDD